MKKQLFENFDQTKFTPLNEVEMKKVLGGNLDEDGGDDDDDEDTLETDLGGGSYCPTIVYNPKTKKNKVKHDC